MLHDVIDDALEAEGVTRDEFQELCIRLLNYGVLCRNESQTELKLYDRYLRISDLTKAWLDLISVRIHHVPRFEYLRLYPPGARVPGMDDVDDNAFGGSLRERLRQDEIALILVLRVQYDKALREGQIDEHGYASESMESLAIAMKTLLKRSLPEKVTERRRVFQRLRQLRLIEYRNEEDIANSESWVKTHPMIVEFVSEEALANLDQAMIELAETEQEESGDVS